MTYGLDQCRRCGKSIPVTGPLSRLDYEASLRKKPTMTEKQWRAAGLKAAPTQRQTWKRADGCCYDCQYPMGLSIVRPWTLLLPAFGCIIAILLFVYFIGTTFT